MRGNNTNNYAEAIFKVVKENLLERTRLFNPVQLLEFIGQEFLSHFREKLLSFVSNVSYSSKKIKEGITIVQIKESVALLNDNGRNYKFSIPQGICQCNKGSKGQSCDHSYFLSSKNYFVPNEICSHLKEVKEKLYFVATGEKLSDVNYFASIHSAGECPTSQFTPPPDIDFDEICFEPLDNEPPTDQIEQENINSCEADEICNPDDCEPEPNRIDELNAKLASAFDDLKNHYSDKELYSAVSNFEKFLRTNLKKTTGLAKITHALKNIDEKPIRKKIRVQNRSIIRRKSGLTTTTSLGAGRFSNGFLKARGIQNKARKHSLKAAIAKNYQNSGKF